VPVALLFTYDPKIEVGRDGRPRKHYMLSHGKNYQQVFNTLLQDVPVQPSDWYRTSLMGQAWTAFVDRLFSAMLQVYYITNFFFFSCQKTCNGIGYSTSMISKSCFILFVKHAQFSHMTIASIKNMTKW
jgi:hypothetical protein